MEQDLSPLEQIIWDRQQEKPDQREFLLVMDLSVSLKAEADRQGGPWEERPATVKQMVAAGLLEYDEVALLPREKLRLFCSRYTRRELGEMLPKRKNLTPPEEDAFLSRRNQSQAGKACSCGNPAYSRGRCLRCYIAWYRAQRRAERQGA